MNNYIHDEKFLLKKYNSKIASTKNRKDKNGNQIRFLLSFEEFCNLWREVDRFPGFPYVISRHNDVGDYVIGNVSIKHNLENVTESMTSHDDYEQKITEYAISKGYKRRIIKSMIARGELVI